MAFRIFLLSVIFVFTFSFSLVRAAELPCEGTEIITIERPLYPDEKDIKTFKFKFQYKTPQSANFPTVIFLPGGPGGTSIGTTKDQIPPEFGIILTDPRGVGCNRVKVKNARRFYSTTNFADDIAAIVSTLNLKNYILYGHSYGTVLATVTAVHIAQLNLTKPTSVVLEGVVGNAIFDVGGGISPKARVWEEVKLELLPAARLALAQPKPMGIDETQWGFFLTAILGAYGEPYTVGLLNLMADPNSAQFQQLKNYILSLSMPSEKDDLDRFELWKIVSCRELAEVMPGYATDVILKNGMWAADSADYCSKIKMDTPYLPMAWQIPVPIYYFVGDRDPQTTPEMGISHFNSQFLAPKHLVYVRGGGHSSLEYSLADCSQTVFSAIAELGDLSKKLTSCKSQTRLINQ